MPRRTSVPMFPLYIPKPVYRQLALLERNFLYYLHKGKRVRVGSYADILQRMFDDNLMICNAALNDYDTFPWLEDAINNYPWSKVLCTKRGIPTMIRVMSGRQSRWIFTPDPWNGKADLFFLHELAQFFDHMGCGMRPSPASLGMAMMRQSWQEYGLDRHTQPNGFACEFLKRHLIGGRVDTPGLGNFYDIADMYDMASAYLAEFSEQATGTSYGFSYGDVSDYEMWFARCEVIIKRELPLGPFPVRKSNNLIVYPTLPGRYEAYLWDIDAQDARDAGCEVKPLEGYGWIETTQDTLHWCKDIYQKKVLADLSGSAFLSEKTKRAIVGAIGKHGASNTYYYLVPEGQEEECDLMIPDVDGLPLPYFVHEEKTTTDNMPHWFSRTLRKCGHDLYQFSLPYAENDTLVATNYDSVITRETKNNRQYIKRHSAESIIVPPGTWRHETLTNLHVRNPRTFVCDQMKTTPGIPHTKWKELGIE